MKIFFSYFLFIYKLNFEISLYFRYHFFNEGRVAQGLEHVATNYGVGGSNPSLPIIIFTISKSQFSIIQVYTIQWGVAKW